MRISDWSSDVCSSDLRPDRIVVHGDTLTTMVATLAAYFRKIPVAHVEAGLRSGDIHHPWPEEVNRMVVACIADLNFAPTKARSEEHTSELQSLMRISYAVFCLKKKTNQKNITTAHRKQ